MFSQIRTTQRSALSTKPTQKYILHTMHPLAHCNQRCVELCPARATKNNIYLSQDPTHLISIDKTGALNYHY
jgi:hypothetical protein